MTIAFIGLGSNLDNPIAHLDRAFTDLDRIPDTKLLVKSSMYRSSPVGPRDQPDFINAVAKLETTQVANILLGYLQEIENRHWLQRMVHWGPRTLDLDILLYGDMIISEANLTVPHREMKSRHFVLYPLMEINEDLEVPGVGMVKDLVTGLKVDPPERING
jgi:2-amino-4-hydroxy-6-hydroxymethyldihydropteridine diphosphokinase